MVWLAVGLALVAATAVGAWWLTRPSTHVDGRVVELDGTPLAGITITFSGGGSATTDGAGQFEVPSRVDAGWVTATGDGYLSRTRAIRAGHETLIRLFPDDGHTIRLLFGGDVMFGRRYYDPNDDGDPSDGLLPRGATAQEHSQLLSGVAPLLSDADLSVVNLESPLASDPWFDPRGARPARFHPTKEFVFASDPAAATAMREAGVDIVGLGNNHQFDLLDAGVASTQQALMAAGFARSDFTGLGRNINEAWIPAVREVRGQKVAVVACTTITGLEHPISYVADVSKGGAARCEARHLAAAVRDAASRGDLVVAMIHGGFEYHRSPSAAIRRYSRIARAAGATLVVNAHPHVTGGVDATADGLTAWSMGNLLFDQTVWPTFSSYVLRVDISQGRVADAYLEPIMLDGYRPVGVVAQRADWVAGQALSLSTGPWVVDDGSLLLDQSHLARSADIQVAPPAATSSDPILDLRGGCLEGMAAAPTMVGHDELWTGDFETLSTDPHAGLGALWTIGGAGADRQVTPDAAQSGAFGIRLVRTGGKRSDITLSPLHRILVQPGEPLTVLLQARGSAADAARLQLSWYNDTLGASSAQTMVPLAVGRDWETLRLDTVVPGNAVAVGLFIRLAPRDLARMQLDLDNIAMIVWRQPSSPASCGYVRFGGRAPAGVLRAHSTHMPAASDARDLPRWITADSLFVTPQAPLPPGPANGGWGSTE